MMKDWNRPFKMTSDSNIYAPKLRFKLMLLFQNPLWHGSSPPQPKAGSGPCWGFELEQQWSKAQMNRRQLLSIFKIPEWGCVRLSKSFANNSNSVSSLAILTVLSSLSLTIELLIVQVWIDSEFSWIFLCLAGQWLILLFRTADSPSEATCLFILCLKDGNITSDSCYLLEQCRFKLLKTQ